MVKCVLGLGLLIVLVSFFERGDAGLADTWDYCNCRWDDWKPWSDCDNTCFGTRERRRSVWLTQYPGCDEFTDCATSDMGKETEGCNEVCHNGGSKLTSSCACVAGYSGQCCSTRITCGSLDSITNGVVSYPHSYYGATASYSCNTHYNLTGGSQTRTCQLDSTWTGQKPSCVYVNHCSSGPCQNGATCTDLLDDYTCTCSNGWSGRHCENDVQPPIMSGCESSWTAYATTHTLTVNWTVPTFSDPMGAIVTVTANYPTNSFTFPWGDYTVQYVATKPSNGLQSECVFEIRVRPTPCDDLNIPAHGARLCNGWRQDYGRFCLVACETSYTIDPSLYTYETMYVCGASGNWITSGPLPDCGVQLPDISTILDVQPVYVEYSYNSTCTDSVTRQSLQNFYISKISDDESFHEFCTNYADECRPEKVLVDCS